MIPTKYNQFFQGKSNNAYLFTFDNEKQYIVKFLKQGQEKILMNEWLGYCISRYLDLPIPSSTIVEIPKTFLTEMEQAEDIIYTPKQFASLYIEGCKNGHEIHKPQLINTKGLAGIIVLDYWLYNTDRTRKNILFKEVAPGLHRLYIIDYADVLGSFAWNINDIYSINKKNLLKSATHEIIAQYVKDKNEFLQQLNIIQAIPAFLLKEILDFPPEDWGLTTDEKNSLVSYLIYRRDKILPRLINKFINKYF